MFFLTETKATRRPSSTYQHYFRSTHRQRSAKFIKQPLTQQKSFLKQKPVGLQNRQEKASRQLEKSIENKQGMKTAKQNWHKIVDFFHLFIETGANTHQTISLPVSGTVTPATVVDQYGSVFSRTGEKNKTNQIRKNSNSFRLGVQEEIQNRIKIQRKSYFNGQQQDSQKMEESREKSKDNKFLKEKSDFFQRDRKPFGKEVDKNQQKVFKNNRSSQNIVIHYNELNFEETNQNEIQNSKEYIQQNYKLLSRYQRNKLNAKIQAQKLKRQREEQKLEKLIEEQKQLRKINLFQCLLKADLSKKYRFNVPQTIMFDQERVLQLINSQNGIVTKKEVKKADSYKIMEKGHQQTLKLLKCDTSEAIYNKMYGNLIDPKANQKAPFVVIGLEDSKKNIRIEVQNVKYFGENSWNSNECCFLQRYIYSRNLKALIMRVIYQKPQRGQQALQYYINRFQNYASIFGQTKKKNNGFHDLKAKVSPSYKREYTLQYSKLTGKGVINRFIQPANEIKRLIEHVNKQKVEKIWIDFIEDVAGTIWVVGIKAVVYQKVQSIPIEQMWLISEQVGTCRLCNGVFQKRHLQNSVSVRMLLQFLNHLRRRTRVQALHNFEFVNFYSLNKKQHAMSAVCQCCYQLIIRQLQLKKYERQLGKLCTIRINDEGQPHKIEGKDLRQWRLMVYFQQINDQHFISSKPQSLIIRYVLSKGIQQKWKCRAIPKKTPIKRVKVHYFFSQTPNIEDFLKNTEILVSVLSEEKGEVIAQGSTGILANFRNKCATENGQRQTSTVLLFFQSGKYCALTLKVGLVYDGVFKVSQMPMKKVNSVMFPQKDWLSSNPLPKQWMQAFGYDQQILLKQVRYQDIMKNKQLNSNKSTLTKKKLKNVF